MYKYIIFTFFFMFSFALSAQEIAGDSIFIDDTISVAETPRLRKYPARLWEVTGNGLKQPSYLYGTMHVSKKLAFNLGDTFYRALQSVDVVALELQIDSWLNNIGRNKNQNEDDRFRESSYDYNGGGRGVYSSALDLNGSGLNDIIGELNNYDYMGNYLLYRQGYQSPNYTEKTYVDMYIHQTGKKLGKYCTGLEDFEISSRMVSRSDWRERMLTHKSNAENGGRFMYGYGEDPLETAYREGDLDMIDSMDRTGGSTKFYRKWMLFERNKVMANEFERITKTKRLFAAVGCAHLPGDSGVIEFLRRKGFVLKPIYDNVGDYAFKQKIKLDAIGFPVSFSKYYSHTGELEFALPGKPVDRSYANKEEIFYADVANGAYYVLKRMPWFGNLKGVSREKFLKQIDSALFEHVPGDITSKEKLKINGNPALLIGNKTKTGETQKHLFLILQNHLWYVKLSATGNYAESKEAKEFFKSVVLKPIKTAWKTYSPPSGGYSLNWPTSVDIKPYSFDTSTEFKGHENLEFTDAKNNYYFLNQIQSNNLEADADTFHMRQMAVNCAFYNEGKMEKFELKKIAGHQAATASIYLKKSKKYLHLLLAADKDVYYYLGEYTADKMPEQNFMGSFQFIDFKYKYKALKKFDSTAGFSYARPDWAAIDKRGRVFREEQEMKRKELVYPEEGYDLYGFNRPNDTLSPHYKSVPQILLNSGEAVSILSWYSGAIASQSNFKEMKKNGVLKGKVIDNKRYKELNDSIRIKTILDYKKENKAKYYAHNQIQVYLDTLFWKNNWMVNELITGYNMNSIRNYYFSASDEVNSIIASTSYDVNRGISVYVKNILESVDYKDKKRMELDSQQFAIKMLKWLNSRDSLDLFRAMDYGYSVNILPKEFNDSLFKLMAKFSKNTDWGSEYAELLENKLVKDAYLPLIQYYMDKFRQSGDTSEVQAKMLTKLATLKNKTAMDTLMYWLLEETPLAPENSYSTYTFGGIINSAYDTLKLWKNYYKQMLPLLRYKEYREPIMALGITLLDSGMIDSSVFKGMISELTLSFRDDLKRKMSKAQNSYYPGTSYNGGKGSLNADRYQYGSFGNTLFNNSGTSWTTNSEAYSDYATYESEYYLNSSTGNSMLNVTSRMPITNYYTRNYGASNSEANGLYDKAKILIKYYAQDADVAKRLNRIYQLKNKEEKMQYLDLYLKNKISIPDTMYTHYLAKKDCEFGFVQMLRKRGEVKKIPANYFEEMNYVNSFVHYNHFSESGDSVVFVGKKAAGIEGETGNLYFWKSRLKEKKGEKLDLPWNYSMVWIGHKDTISKLDFPRYFKFDIALNKKTTMREIMNNEAAELEFWKHYYWEPLLKKETEKVYGGSGWDGE